MIFFKKIGICLATSWRLWKEMWQIIRGLYTILDLTRPSVSFFGGSRLPQDSMYAQHAYTLAAKFVQHGISVLTGGGPGIMEAGNCGAMSVAKKNETVTIGVGVRGLGKQQSFNRCAEKTIMFDYFFSRKWLLIHYSVGYVIFPGGFGTMDELSDLLCQMQTEKLPVAPVVLIGTEFWKPYLAWVEEARKAGLLSATNAPKITVTNDLDYAVNLLVEHCKQCVF